MEDYFNKYIDAKNCLLNMISQFYTVYISKENIYKENILEDDKYDIDENFIEVCFHDFSSDGLLAWNYLNLNNNFIYYSELNDIKNNLRNEKKEDSKDYYLEYLKISILLIDMVKKFYSKKISINDLKKINVDINKENIEFDKEIVLCDNIGESAGESIWRLFEIDKNIVSENVFNTIRENYSNILKTINNENSKYLIKRINKKID